jgi:hypothetical protein
MASPKRHGEFRGPRRQRVGVVTNPPKAFLLGILERLQPQDGRQVRRCGGLLCEHVQDFITGKIDDSSSNAMGHNESATEDQIQQEFAVIVRLQQQTIHNFVQNIFNASTEEDSGSFAQVIRGGPWSIWKWRRRACNVSTTSSSPTSG